MTVFSTATTLFEAPAMHWRVRSVLTSASFNHNQIKSISTDHDWVLKQLSTITNGSTVATFAMVKDKQLYVYRIHAMIQHVDNLFDRCLMHKTASLQDFLFLHKTA